MKWVTRASGWPTVFDAPVSCQFVRMLHSPEIEFVKSRKSKHFHKINHKFAFRLLIITVSTLFANQPCAANSPSCSTKFCTPHMPPPFLNHQFLVPPLYDRTTSSAVWKSAAHPRLLILFSFVVSQGHYQVSVRAHSRTPASQHWRLRVEAGCMCQT